MLARRGYFPKVFDEFFDNDVLPDFFDKESKTNIPAVNVMEEADKFKIDVAAPGLEKKDFNIDLDNNVLTISSEKEAKKEDESEKFVRREFSYSAFKRSFTLPDSVDSDKITAAHKDGVLTISIPKKEEAVEKPPKKIDIK